jgi:hypothetical protein
MQAYARESTQECRIEAPESRQYDDDQCGDDEQRQTMAWAVVAMPSHELEQENGQRERGQQDEGVETPGH